MPWAGVYRCVGEGLPRGGGGDRASGGGLHGGSGVTQPPGRRAVLGKLSHLSGLLSFSCVWKEAETCIPGPLAVRGAGRLSRVHLWGKCPTHPLISVLVCAFPPPAGLPESVGSVPKSGLSSEQAGREQDRQVEWSQDRRTPCSPPCRASPTSALRTRRSRGGAEWRAGLGDMGRPSPAGITFPAL